MVSQQIVQFHECFECVEDPRVRGKFQHPLQSLLLLITAAVIAGADGPTEIEEFGIEKEDWLFRIRRLPRRNTFARYDWSRAWTDQSG